MKLASNIMRFNAPFGLKKTIDIFSEAGVEGIDFNSDIEEYYTDAHDKNFYTEMKKYAQSKGIVFSQAHAPFASSFLDEEKTKKRFNEIVTGMKHASYLGTEMIVVHPCKHIDYTVEENREKIYEYNIDFYKRLIPYSEEYNIKIAIENINGTPHNTHSVSSSAESLARLYDELNNDSFVVCFDTGHVNILGDNPAESIKKLGKRIKCLHVHDNLGVADDHTIPYYGNIDWESIMTALVDIGYEGDFSYEASTFLQNLPIELYSEGIKYMSLIGHHLIDRFEYYKFLK